MEFTTNKVLPFLVNRRITRLRNRKLNKFHTFLRYNYWNLCINPGKSLYVCAIRGKLSGVAKSIDWHFQTILINRKLLHLQVQGWSRGKLQSKGRYQRSHWEANANVASLDIKGVTCWFWKLHMCPVCGRVSQCSSPRTQWWVSRNNKNFPEKSFSTNVNSSANEIIAAVKFIASFEKVLKDIFIPP